MAANTQAHAQETLAGLCTPAETEVFACVLKSRQEVGFCLGRSDLKMRLAVSGGESQASSPLRNLREATIGSNAHGDIVTLQGTAKDGPVALYVDFIADDLLAPVLVLNSGKQEIKESCASAAFVSKSEVVSVGGAMRVVRLAALAELGIAKPLTPAPDWPD